MLKAAAAARSTVLLLSRLLISPLVAASGFLVSNYSAGGREGASAVGPFAAAQSKRGHRCSGAGIRGGQSVLHRARATTVAAAAAAAAAATATTSPLTPPVASRTCSLHNQYNV